MLMRLRMLKLSIGKGRQVIKQLCLRVFQYYATVATERAGYLLYRALVKVGGQLGGWGLAIYIYMRMVIWVTDAWRVLQAICQ